MLATRNFSNLVHKFHNDEDGLQALDTIMIVAVAALVLVGVLNWGRGDFFSTVTGLVRDIIGG